MSAAAEATTKTKLRNIPVLNIAATALARGDRQSIVSSDCDQASGLSGGGPDSLALADEFACTSLKSAFRVKSVGVGRGRTSIHFRFASKADSRFLPRRQSP